MRPFQLPQSLVISSISSTAQQVESRPRRETLSFSKSVEMMMPPSSRLKTAPSQGMLPLILTLPVDAKSLLDIHPQLLRSVTACVVRGVVYNQLSKEYSNALTYWLNREDTIPVRRDVAMMQLDEAFELIVPIFANLARELSIYAEEPELVTDLLNFDAVDGSMTVRISDA